MWGHKESEGRTGRIVGNNFPSHQVPGLNTFSKPIKGNSQGFAEEGNQHLPRLFNIGVIIPNVYYYPDTAANCKAASLIKN